MAYEIRWVNWPEPSTMQFADEEIERGVDLLAKFVEQRGVEFRLGIMKREARSICIASLIDDDRGEFIEGHFVRASDSFEFGFASREIAAALGRERPEELPMLRVGNHPMLQFVGTETRSRTQPALCRTSGPGPNHEGIARMLVLLNRSLGYKFHIWDSDGWIFAPVEGMPDAIQLQVDPDVRIDHEAMSQREVSQWLWRSRGAGKWVHSVAKLSDSSFNVANHAWCAVPEEGRPEDYFCTAK